MRQHESLHYRSYLLRCWAECDERSNTPLWRFSLEDTRTGQRRGFASLNELVVALEAELASNRKETGEEHVQQSDE